MPLSCYFDTRAEIEVPTQVQVIFGWVMPESKQYLILEVEDGTVFTPGMTALIKLSSFQQCTEFASNFLGRDGIKTIFSVPTSVVRLPGSTSARLRNKVESGKLTRSGQTKTVPILDISSSGISLEIDSPISADEILNLELTLFDETVPFNLQTAYCRPDPRKEGAWRVGGIIVDMGRTDQVRWRRILSQA